jgi:hypothetical protein
MMKMPAWVKDLALLVAIFASIQAQSAHAAFGITSVTGATQLPGPPAPNVLPGSVEQPIGFPIPLGNPIIFHEVLTGVVRPVAPTPLHPFAAIGLDVDHNGSNVSAAPVVSGNVVNPLLVPALIPVGTQFNSYLLHFDPLGSPSLAIYNSTINFDNPIIGVQLFSNGFNLQKPAGTPYQGTLEQGDTQVFLNGGPGLAYYPGTVNYPPLGLNFRGVEEDALQITIVGNQLTLAGQVFGGEIDQIRILTAAVPEPASAIAWTMILAVGCAVAYAKRRS